MDKWQIMRHEVAASFAKRCRQEAEMQEQTFAAGECPNCGHDWTAHGDYIARGEKVCWTFDPAIMDERNPYYVGDAIASECDVADELVAVLVIQCDEIIHTDEHPYCDDPSCGCHVLTDNLEPYDRYIDTPMMDGLLTQDEASRLFYDRQV